MFDLTWMMDRLIGLASQVKSRCKPPPRRRNRLKGGTCAGDPLAWSQHYIIVMRCGYSTSSTAGFLLMFLAGVLVGLVLILILVLIILVSLAALTQRRATDSVRRHQPPKHRRDHPTCLLYTSDAADE